MAEALQGLSVALISEEFAAKNDANTQKDITNFETFVEELTAAHENGTIDEFNKRVLALLQPAITMAMQPPQQAPAQKGP